jgi:hypothetical protein
MSTEGFLKRLARTKRKISGLKLVKAEEGWQRLQLILDSEVRPIIERFVPEQMRAYEKHYEMPPGPPLLFAAGPDVNHPDYPAPWVPWISSPSPSELEEAERTHLKRVREKQVLVVEFVHELRNYVALVTSNQQWCSSPSLPGLEWSQDCIELRFKEQRFQLTVSQAQIMKEVISRSDGGPTPIPVQSVLEAVGRSGSQIRMLFKGSPIWQGLLKTSDSPKGTVRINLKWDPPSSRKTQKPK